MAITISVAGSYNDRDIKRAQRDLEKLGAVAGDQGKSITDSMDKLSAGMVAAGSALTKSVTLPVVAAGTAMFAAFTKQEDAEARLRAAIKATGGVAGVSADHIFDLASSLQETTTFGDEATIAAAGLLLTFKDISNAAGDGNDVFDRTIKVGQDLAAFMGTDLDSAMMQLGMAINNPAEGLGRLTRSGINFSDEQKDMIKQMVETGDTLGAQKAILAEVESQFGGTAETMAQTSSGQIKQALNSLGDAAEDFGEIIAKTVDRVAQFLRRLGERFQALSPETKEMIVTVAAIAAAIGPLLVVGGKLIGMASSLIKVVLLLNKAFLMNPIGLVVAALVALGVLLFLAYQRFEGFREVVDKAFNVIKDVISYAWENVIKPIFEALVEAVQEHLMPVIKRLWDAFQEAWPGIQEALETAWDVIQPILEFLIDLFVQIYTKYLTTLIQVWSTVFNTAITVISVAWGVISTVFNAVWGFIQDKLVPVFQTIGRVVGTVWGGISSAISGAWGIISGVFDKFRSGLGSLRDFISTAANRIKSIFSGIGEGIQEAFRGAFNFVAQAWNNTIGTLSWTVPGWVPPPFGGKSISAPQIPEFAKGGMVPGPVGAPMLAIVHGGEQILRPPQVAGTAGQASAGGDTYNVTINGLIGRDKQDVLEFLARELPRAAASQARRFG